MSADAASLIRPMIDPLSAAPGRCPVGVVRAVRGHVRSSIEERCDAFPGG